MAINYYLKADEMGLLNDVYGIDVKKLQQEKCIFNTSKCSYSRGD